MSARQSLKGNEFAALIRAGHAKLKANVNVVNSLNIFPVPDGDTGTNMELSLASGVKSLLKQTDWTLSAATQALSSGLLMGARGNSGVILSQLFRGFIKVTQKTEELDCQAFANALYEGVQIAYKAVAKPVEGTILTVAREAASAGLKASKSQLGLEEWFEVVHQAALKALHRTPEQLPVLKQAGVVDSGGQGLVFIYEGFLNWLWGKDIDEAHEGRLSDNLMVRPLELDFAAAHIDHDGEYGYCTEVLIRTETEQTESVELSLRKTLSAYGDSLLVVGAEHLVKVHVHTLHPGRVLEDALTHGTLAKIKIENMTEQHTDIREQRHLDEPTTTSELPSTTDEPAPLRPLAIVAVAAGKGLSEIFTSLGVDVVIEGGQTMNPSTEEIVEALESARAEQVIVLPNNKNIVMAAEQAREVLGNSVYVVKSTTIPEGIAAMMAFGPQNDAESNVRRMNQAIQGVHAGQVVRAVRDSVYQGREIRENQYLGFINTELIHVGEDRQDVAMSIIKSMRTEGDELLTVFYGSDINEHEIEKFSAWIEAELGIEVEAKFGGQPIYDYIFTLE